MINITLPDGSVKEFESNSTPMDVARNISEGLARNVISAKFNGQTIETKTPLTTDGSLTLFTRPTATATTRMRKSYANMHATTTKIRPTKI